MLLTPVWNLLRRNGIVGRIGGDEFVAFIPTPYAEWARQKAGNLAEDPHFLCGDGQNAWQISASIGVALAPRGGSTFASLYQAKQKGKHGFTLRSEPYGSASFRFYNWK